MPPTVHDGKTLWGAVNDNSLLMAWLASDDVSKADLITFIQSNGDVTMHAIEDFNNAYIEAMQVKYYSTYDTSEKYSLHYPGEESTCGGEETLEDAARFAHEMADNNDDHIEVYDWHGELRYTAEPGKEFDPQNLERKHYDRF